MYTQSHAGLNSHGMMNGAGHQRFGNQLNLNKQYPHHNPHQHNQHSQPGQDGAHGAHQNNFISHQHNQSGGAAGHFGTSHLQNGAQSNTYSNNTAKAHSEYWQKQMEIATEIRGLTHAHPHARNASTASKTVIPGNSTGGTKDQDKGELRYRTQGDWSDDDTEHSIWTEIDMGGSNLRCISLQLFDYYPFLTKLYLNNNRLQTIPPEIGQLRNLAHLDLSLNQISTLPPEMGMLINLRSLLLVDNKIEVIPYELGNLFALDMLAIEGNPLNDAQLSIIIEQGPQALIRQLREEAPGKYCSLIISTTANTAQAPNHQMSAIGSC
jgi:CCR4-NOT transcription complex subunit 6